MSTAKRLTAATIAAIRRDRAAGDPMRVIAARHDVTIWAVFRLCSQPGCGLVRGECHCGLVRGECHPNARLTEDDVRELRRLAAAGASQRGLARRYGVSQSTIRRALMRTSWAHV